MRRDCGENMKAMLVEPLTVGPIVGYTTDTTCRLWGRGPDAAGARVFGVARAFPAATRLPVAEGQFKMMAKFDYTGVVDLMGLVADTAYDYEIGFVRGEAAWDALPDGAPLDWNGASSGAVRTNAPPGTPAPVSFVLGSCRYLLLKWILHWGEESGDKAFRSILEQMAREVRTDCLLMVGDQIYADDFKGIDPDDHLDEFLERYRIAFGQPFIRQLMSRVPTYMILDDHEIKDAWTMDMRPGREALYAAALSAYQSYQVVHGPAFDLSGPGEVEFSRTPTRYWYKYDLGPARFFVLDTRNERYVNLAGAEPRIISTVQMSALVQWLVESPADAPKFVVSSVPMFPDDRSEIRDKWAGFPQQRRQVLEEIRSRGVRKVVFLSGDVHCSGWSELRCENDPSFRVYSVISSPFFFPGPRLGQGDRFDLRGTIPNPPHDFVIGGHGPILGDDAFTRVSLDADATVMRVDVYDRKGGLLDGVALPL
ncbi:MAG: alkaline phosphatase [Acidobacteria bacterium]|nr:MAG: alkaline phosphatase [Acidobacteriota bacterium]